MATFKMPTKIYLGLNSIEALREIKVNKVLIICDPFMVQSNKVSRITDLLNENEQQYCIFSEIVPDPTIEVVTQGVAQAADFTPEAIIALGGGSALDTAKVVRYIYQMAVGNQDLPLICIPTTSGTGSEVTSFAVISDPQVDGKYALVDDTMIPEVAILDPEFTLTVPAQVTADTGMDVLTHSLEAYVSTAANDFTDACAEKAMRIIFENLVEVTKQGGDVVLREKIHNASCLAGIAFSEASLGICHSLAHALGGKFHITHGRANTMLLPHVIAYNAGLDLEKDLLSLAKYQAAANLLGIQAGTKRATVHRLIASITQKSKVMQMPQSIQAFGINDADFIAAIPEMAVKAMQDKCTLTNPRKPKQEELEALYLRLLKGGY